MKNKMEGLQVGQYALGDQEIDGGRYEKLRTLGNLVAQNCTFYDLSILGEAKLTNCDVVKMSVKGEAMVLNSKVDFVEVLGKLSLRGKMQCWGIRVVGEIESEDTTCRILQFGSASWFHAKRKQKRTMKVGHFKAETLQNFFPICLNGNQQFKTIINSGQLEATVALTCERFISFGPCGLLGLNAEMIYLFPSSHVKIEELQGSVVVIDEQFDHEQWLQGVSMDVSARDIQTQSSRSRVRIGSIEADEIVVNHIECKSISGNRVVIGEYARIDRVEYMDSCEIHPNALVKEVVKR